MPKFNIPVPHLQIDFSVKIDQVRNLYLQEALCSTIDDVNLGLVDTQLVEYVPEKNLKALAKHGLRGELVFPVPCILEKNPYLLGYYRLLLGFSQKEFYTSHFGLSSFKPLEEKGMLPDRKREELPDLCRALIESSVALVDGIGTARISKELLDDLSLLTVGPQLRGGANVRKGVVGIVDVFQAIYGIVENSIVFSDSSKIEIENAAGRKVLIEFSPDPDIVIREEINAGKYRNIIAIEVKGGTDFSNIHNRVGEAEKSHQKAKASGYVECWTVVNVDRIDMVMAKRESPSTNSFYKISSLKTRKGDEYQDFKDRMISLTGIRN